MYLLWKSMARLLPEQSRLISRLRACIGWGLGLGLLSWLFSCFTATGRFLWAVSPCPSPS
ncbi:MAG: hypothetical protein U5K31_06820 [Balneolaceae bacterium]|nr:hypothetical protein [Balneolaceae bacterium]